MNLQLKPYHQARADLPFAAYGLCCQKPFATRCKHVVKCCQANDLSVGGVVITPTTSCEKPN